MTSTAIAALLINALWQIPVIAMVASLAVRALRRAPARQQHLVWAAALILSVALPLWSTWPRKVATPTTPSRSGSSPPSIVPSTFSLDALLATTKRPTSSGVNPATWLAVAWGAVTLYRAFALLVAWQRTRTILRSANTNISAEVIDRCRPALGIHVPIVSSRAVVTPMTLGAIDPVIILPEALLAELTDDALISLVGHELAHIRRRDFVINIVFEIVAIPIAFHPITALLKRRVAETRELACDEEVTPGLVAPRDYARALVDVAAFVSAAPTPTYSLTMAGGDFEDRIRRIVRRKTMKHSRALIAAAWAALTVTSVAVAGIAVHPQLSSGADRTDTPRFADRIEVSPARFSSPGAEARAAAACDAGRARDVNAIPMLMAMLGDDTRIRPMRCYGNGWNPAMESFDHPSPGEQAALALASISKPAVASLVNALDDPSPVVRRNAAWAIGEVRGSSSIERDHALLPLIRLLTDVHPTVRRAAAFGLSELKMKDGVEPLIVALSDTDAAVRGTIVFALGEIRDRRATTALSQTVVGDSDPEVRRAAAWALGEIRDPRAVDALNAASNDPHVRQAARHALAEIDDHGNP